MTENGADYSMLFDLTGKTALVTGSTQGIGFAIAELLAKQGAKVFINGRAGIEKCQKAADSIPCATPVVADVSKAEDIEKLYNLTGGVDILVLNASHQEKKNWDDFSENDLNLHFDTNVKSSYMMIKKYAPYMKENSWGRIVTLGSVNQYNNHPELSIYAATKAAQMKLVENIAPQLAPFGVTINNIAPGAINTPRNSQVLSDAEFNKKVTASIPCGYVGLPSDVAPAVLLLCSDEGRYITGAELIIDGGMRL